MLKSKSHEVAARRLAEARAEATAAIDQAEAAARDAEQALHDCEFLRLRREHAAAQRRLEAVRENADRNIADAELVVRQTSPIAGFADQLGRMAFAKAEQLRASWDQLPTRFTDPERLAALAERAEHRDRQLSAWVDLYQTLPRLLSSTRPQSDLAALLERHAETLPELQHFRAGDIPQYETELSNAE